MAWAKGKPKGPKIPYRLSAMLKADEVFVVEGEKCADRLAAIGLVATTSSEGAGKWKPELNKWFASKTVYILPDNDKPGADHAATVAKNLRGIAHDLRVVTLPGLPDKGDVVDWLDNGGDAAKLAALCKDAPRAEAPADWDQIETEMNAPEPRGLILSPGTPMHSARALVAFSFTKDKLRTLHRHRAAFWSWTGSYFDLVDQETVRSKIWAFLEKAKRREKAKDKDGNEKFEIVPFKPKSSLVTEVADALRAVTQLDGRIDPPTWLNDDTLPPANEFFACTNGFLHLPSGEMYPPTPQYFGLVASEVLFDLDAPEPVKWIAFLHELFGDDQQAIELLQEWFGYSLAPDTSQQKILLIVGPKRSGKGTIARVLKKLLGSTSVAGPTMSSLGETFGLEPLITKSLAIVSDARIGPRTDKSAIIERLLSISGEDQMTIARKFIGAWHGQLQTRFVILTNELPALADGSGALAGRFIALLLTQTFFGREDRALTEKLLTELPGILNWAIEGYRRLRERGRFVVPDSAQEAIDDIETLGAPVKAFIRERCVTDPRVWVTVDDLWAAWKSWSDKEGSADHIGTKQWFGRNLRSAEPRVIAKKILKPKAKGTRTAKLSSQRQRMSRCLPTWALTLCPSRCRFESQNRIPRIYIPVTKARAHPDPGLPAQPIPSFKKIPIRYVNARNARYTNFDFARNELAHLPTTRLPARQANTARGIGPHATAGSTSGAEAPKRTAEPGIGTHAETATGCHFPRYYRARSRLGGRAPARPFIRPRNLHWRLFFLWHPLTQQPLTFSFRSRGSSSFVHQQVITRQKAGGYDLDVVRKEYITFISAIARDMAAPSPLDLTRERAKLAGSRASWSRSRMRSHEMNSSERLRRGLPHRPSTPRSEIGCCPSPARWRPARWKEPDGLRGNHPRRGPRGAG